MIPLTQAVIVVCIVALTGVLISTLISLRKIAIRAESVLSLLEREIQPLAHQVESLTADLRTLSQHATREMERIGGAVTRLEDVTGKVARLVGALAGLTQVGQLAGAAVGVKKGVSVFLSRLRDKP
ncbi:MAG TPA: DUF948 domain-containing protein [Candidatus Methylomirabilis sp.]|nr:DUF948 domain-containing protein [Candidatus Methylomirabilis sp.]